MYNSTAMMNQSNTTKKGSTTIYFIIACVVIILLSIYIGIGWWMFTDSSEESSPSPGPSMNCIVNWSDWKPCNEDTCANAKGDEYTKYHYRTGVITQNATNGGRACPAELLQFKSVNPNNTSFSQAASSQAASSQAASSQATSSQTASSQTASPVSKRLEDFKQSSKKFRLGLYDKDSLKCMRIDMGGNNTFNHKDDIHIQDCDTSDMPQYWMYDNGKIKTVRTDVQGRILCLDWNNDKFKVTRCDEDPEVNRMFELIGPDDDALVNVNGKYLWNPSHNLDNVVIPIRIQASSDNNKRCIANPSRDETTTNDRVTSCTSDATKLYIMLDD